MNQNENERDKNDLFFSFGKEDGLISKLAIDDPHKKHFLLG